MYRDGRMYFCDRCKKQEFVETTDKFLVPLPPGWERTGISLSCSLLCNECNKEWENTKYDFITDIHKGD